MKTTIDRVLIIAAAAVSLSVAAIADQHAQGDHGSESTPLEDVMDDLGGAYKKLARAMRAPKAEDIAMYQAQAAIIRTEAIKAKKLVPILAEESGDQKDEMIAAYRKSMDTFIGLAENLEIVLAEGDLAKAQTVVGKLNDARKKGHEKFKKPDDE